MGLRSGRVTQREDGQVHRCEGGAGAAQADEGDRRHGLHGQARQRVHRHGPGVAQREYE